MCGLIVASGATARERVAAALPLITHRGPDDQGLYFDERHALALGAARLSIIDLAGGHQPMVSANGRFVLAWNGEIFNAQRLRARLESAGVRFSTGHSDTEVVLEGFAREGENLFGHLNGMYALAIWDRQSGRLTLARDPFGVKPLFLVRRPGHLAAASEVPALLAVAGLTPELDETALQAYLDLGYVPGPRVGLRGVESLSPGTWLRLDASGSEVASGPISWSQPVEPSQVSMESPFEMVREGLVHAVRRWSTSDVPIALSLSGGLDSSAILSSAVKAGVPIQCAYTAYFADIDHEENQELKTAAETAKYFGVEHIPVPIYGDNVRENFWAIVRSIGQPYGGSVPSWFLYESVSKDFKVCLTGTGGDELFGQYGKWIPIAERALGQMPPDLSRKTGSSLRYTLKRAAYHFGQPLISSGRRSALARQFASARDWSDAYPLSAFPSHLLAQGVSPGRCFSLSELSSSPRHGELARWMTDLECRSQLPGEFLTVTDRLSMAHSVEARVPFLDQEFVATIQGIPDKFRLTRADPKWLLRRALDGELPASVLTAPKRGFTDPVARLLDGPLRPLARDIIESADTDILSVLGINLAALRAWLAESRPELAAPVWRVLMAIAWWETLTLAPRSHLTL